MASRVGVPGEHESIGTIKLRDSLPVPFQGASARASLGPGVTFNNSKDLNSIRRDDYISRTFPPKLDRYSVSHNN
jgi:hypothetical protein